MKKLIAFILTVFTVATLFAAARPSLDGRAVVAESGTMPRGLFARTVGYLPGDSVTVTNPATGSTVDVLILGAIDPSEGVAILLSPEAAEALRIKPDSNVQVKLTKRSGSLDENASGSAVLAEENDEVPPATEEQSADEAVPEPEDSAASESAEQENSAEYAVEEVPAEVSEAEEHEPERVEVAEPEKKESADDSALPVREILPPVTEEIPEPAEEYVPEETEEPLQQIILVPVEPEEKIQNTTEDKPESIEEIVPAEPEEKIPDAEKENLEPVEEIAPAEPRKDETVSVEKCVPEEIASEPEPEVAEPVGNADESAPEAAEPRKDDSTSAEKCVPEEIASEPEPEVAETTDESEPVADSNIETYVEPEPEVVVECYEEAYPAEPAPADDSEVGTDGDEMFQPIVLVPAEPNPPEEEPAADPKKSEESVAEPAPAEPEPSESAAHPEDWSRYVVPSMEQLERGMFYIQIATLGNRDNIANVVRTYAEKYPLVLVRHPIKELYSVMVGPLSIDEYGSVLEKFKAFGYTDSFVRNIK